MVMVMLSIVLVLVLVLVLVDGGVLITIVVFSLFLGVVVTAMLLLL